MVRCGRGHGSCHDGIHPIDSVYYRLIAKTATETYTSSAVQAVYVVPAIRLTASNAEKLNDYEYEVEQGKPYGVAS